MTIFKPMLANGGTVDMQFSDAWVCEGKIDGHRAMIFRDVDGVVHQFNGRNSADYTGHLPYMDQALAGILPPDTCVDGELLSPLGREHVQHVMFTQQPHVSRDPVRDPELYLILFDVLRIAGRDVRSAPWTERRQELSELPTVNGYVRLSMILPNDIGLQVALDAGLEGVVFKRRTSTYQSRRSSDWVKIKPTQTCEAIVRGFKDGKKGGAWDGKVGAFQIELVDGELNPTGITTTVKCGSDDYHWQATAERDGKPIAPLWEGALIEVGHSGIQKSGVPLHPRNKGRRRDLMTPEQEAQLLPPGYRNLLAARRSTDRRTPPVASTKRRTRNYKQMKDDKLLRVTQELRDAGEAFDVCVESGSGDPTADLQVCEQLLAERQLAA